MKENSDALNCDSCELWFHLKCTDVDEILYKIIGEDASKRLMWFCQNREGDVSVALKTFTEMDVIPALSESFFIVLKKK